MIMSNCFIELTGTKNVARGMKLIAVGAVKRAGKTWFPELSDKSIAPFNLMTSSDWLFIHNRKEYKNSFVPLHEEL